MLIRLSSRMTRRIGIIAVCAGLLVAACATAPVTGRRQLILLPDSQANALGVSAYQDLKQSMKISQDREKVETVNRIGRRLVAVADGPGFDWEFTVFEDPTPNAFALPGGKVGVHTGLFDVAKNEAQLAAVIGHELAHAIIRHGSERMSQQMVVQLGVAALGTQTQSQELVALAAQAATLGVIMPFSRGQESEADEVGLIYMARAGYDPRAAVDLWQNFAALGGQRPPEFLSTHPGPENRIKKLQALMPEALEIYRANQRRGS